MELQLTPADLEAHNAQVRFRKLKRKRTTCQSCGRRTMCSIRLKVCQVCFHGEKLRQKNDDDFDFDDLP